MMAISWLRKQPRSDYFAAWLYHVMGAILLRNDFSIWGNHLSGNLNFIADTVSRSISCLIKEMLNEILYKYSSHNFNLPSPIFHQNLLSYLMQ